jgi:acetyl esterase/lipase
MPFRLPALVILLLSPALAAADATPEVIHLWSDGAPGFENRRDEPEQAKDYWVRNIHNPSVTVFRPPPGRANGCAVVVAPGGGFKELVFEAEGRQPSVYLNSIGVTTFALKYRLPKEVGSPYTLDNVRQDAHRAVRLVRSRAREFEIDPRRIGMLGFSVGGTLVFLTAFDKGEGDPGAADPIDRASGRPDFEMIIYPGMGELLPNQVPPDTPPAFLLCANDDEYGCDKVALALLEKFRKANVPVEAHFLAQGKHAFNMGDHSAFLAVRHWPDRMGEWMNDRGWLRPAAEAAAASR